MSIPVPNVPKYETTLPISNKKVSYRPFLVKEEKILLLSKEENNVNTGVKTILENCTFNLIDVNKLPVADVEFLFINIRSKSIGEKINGKVTCSSCENKMNYVVDLEKVKVLKPDVSNKIKINDNTMIVMRYPTLNSVKDIDFENIDNPKETVKIVVSCIDSIYVNESCYDRENSTDKDMEDFLENLMQNQLDMIIDFIQNLPRVFYKDKLICNKCGHENTVYMEGLLSFFTL